MTLVKCTTSFLVGFYLAFVLTLSVTGWIMATDFVSKASLKTKIVYIDGKIYDVKERRN